MRLFLLTIMNGFTLAALYFLVASGFTLVFGLMRNVNLAHGSLYLLGAYIGYDAADLTGSWFVGVAAGFLSMAAAGLLLQIGIFRRMEGQELRQTLVTIGISIVLADLMLAIWGGKTYQFTPPDWLYGAVRVPFIRAYPIYRLALLVAAIVIGIGLWLFLNRTRIGMMIRAGVDDRAMLQASGVNTQRIFAITFALGAGLAGLAGCALTQIGNVGPSLGQNYIVDSFMVVVTGGVGKLLGTILAAAGIGTLNKGIEPALGAVFAKVAILIAVILFLQRRPAGLFATRGRGAEA